MLTERMLQVAAYLMAQTFQEACAKSKIMPSEHELQLLAEYFVENVRALYAQPWNDEV